MEIIKDLLCVWKQFFGHIADPSRPVAENDRFLNVVLSKQGGDGSQTGDNPLRQGFFPPLTD
jgi:hypothetical protein